MNEEKEMEKSNSVSFALSFCFWSLHFSESVRWRHTVLCGPQASALSVGSASETPLTKAEQSFSFSRKRAKTDG